MNTVKNVIVTVLGILLLGIIVLIFFHGPIFSFVNGVMIRPGEVSMAIGETTTLSAKREKSDVVWESGNKKVAKVDQSGVVTAVAPGKTSITVSSGKAIGSCVVTVRPVEAEEVTFGKESLVLARGKTKKMKAKVKPKGTLDKSLKWSSSDPTVAQVDKTGKVTGVSRGVAYVTASTQNDITASCKVTVTSK